MKALLLFICFVATAPALAQEPVDEALEPNDSLYSTMEIGNTLYGGNYGRTSVKSFSMRAYMPTAPVAISGGLSWTTAISKAMSAQLGFEKQWNMDRIEKEAFSPYFLFDLLPKATPRSCKLQNDWMKQTQHLLISTGNVKLSDYPRKRIDCASNGNAAVSSRTARYPVRAFTRLFVHEASDRGASTGQKQFVLKRSLGRNHPVVMCMMADERFTQLKTDQWTPRFSAEKTIFQAVIVVGFDDHKQAFEIAHPAGRGWGKGGFAWVSYKDLIYAKYAFEITLEADPVRTSQVQHKPQARISNQRPTPAAQKRKTGSTANAPAKIADSPRTEKLAGALVLNTVDPEGNFVSVPVRSRAAGYYTLEKAYGVSSQFQLVGYGGTANSFIYVISVDPAGKAELHYPYQRKFGMSVTEIGSPLLPEPQSQVVIPEPVVHYDERGNQFRKERVFIKQHPGTDWLVTLYSNRRLDQEIDELLHDLAGHNEDFPQRFRQVFDRKLVPNALVRFEHDRLHFTTSPMTQPYVVPVIVKIDGN